MNKTFDQMVEAIQNSQTIYIASHVNPDGDNLGSSLALYKALKNIGKEVYILEVDNIPDNYMFLPGINNITNKSELSHKVYTFIALDSADKGRLGINEDLADKAKILLNIDHHISNPKYGHINLVDSEASATGELVYQLIKDMNIELDKNIAECLYTAISSDTGSFMYSNTTSRTHDIVSDLYNYDMNVNKINIQLYQSKSLNKVKLFNEVISKMELYYDNQVAIALVDQILLEKTSTTIEDTEGLVENIRDIKEVELAILIKEESKEFIKVSTRSKREIDVSILCSKFNGGGHKRAAGCTMYTDIIDAKNKLLEELELII